jgi:hypothetical protein
MIRQPFLIPLVVFFALMLGVTGATAQQPEPELAAMRWARSRWLQQSDDR